MLYRASLAEGVVGCSVVLFVATVFIRVYIGQNIFPVRPGMVQQPGGCAEALGTPP